MLKVKEITVFYGQARALNGVSLEVYEGKIACLLGANGAGKTTTLRAISGLVTPTSGSIEFQGKQLIGTPTHDIVKLGISHVLEGRRIFPKMTVRENLELGAYTQNDKAQIKENLEEVHSYFPVLKERENQIAGTLSGGERQMLAMGRSLMSRPKLYVLDEPSLGLAPMIVQTIAEIIQNINERGTTILLVEQNARLALKISDRAYILENGRIALHGESKELLQDIRVKKTYLAG